MQNKRVLPAPATGAVSTSADSVRVEKGGSRWDSWVRRQKTINRAGAEWAKGAGNISIHPCEWENFTDGTCDKSSSLRRSLGYQNMPLRVLCLLPHNNI